MGEGLISQRARCFCIYGNIILNLEIVDEELRKSLSNIKEDYTLFLKILTGK